MRKINRPLPPWDSPEADAARPRWQKLNQQTVFENPWIRIESHDVLAPSGHKAHYGLVCFANRAVGVLPLHDDGTVTMVGQMRFALDAYSWEMPEGGVPFDEDLREGALRELREEVGLEADTLTEILTMDLSNSVCDEVAVCYLATGLSYGQSAPEETETFETVRVPFKAVLGSVIRGEIRDSLTVATVLRVHYMAVSGELPPALAEQMLKA